MAERYDPNVPLRTPAAPAVMPARADPLFQPKSPVPEQVDELAYAMPFGAGSTEEGSYEGTTMASHNIARRAHRRGHLGFFVGGAVFMVALAVCITYAMLDGKSPVSVPPIVADNGEQNMRSNESVDGTPTASISKADLASAAPNAAASDDHPAAVVAPVTDADADQVSAGKPPASAAPVPAAVASAEAGGPLKPTEGKSGKQTPESSGGVFVQVSVQKSENAARFTYRALQVKFPAIFGKLDPNIRRVDLGDKGIYFRVRVGPLASADAQKICGSYKAAGGDCRIAQH